MIETEPQLWNQSAPKDGGRSARILAWLREHSLLFRETLEHVTRNLFVSLLAWILIGIALSLPLGLYLVQRSLSSISEPWLESPGVTVYLERGVAQEQRERLERVLLEDPRIDSLAYLSPKQALEEFGELTGLKSLIEDFEEHPLPASFDVVPVANLSAEEFQRLSEEISAIEEVQDVVAEGLWLDRVLAVTELVERLTWVLAGLFGLGAVLVTASSVRLVIESRLAELQVMSLVGATPRFMRRPFLYFGVVYGFGGGLMATMLISGAIILVREPARRLLGSYGVELAVPGFDGPILAFLFLSAALIGAIGALAACARRLKSLDN